ncbi:MAG TPA: hypothetical protein DEH22_13895 [Chloroflexi bacterium]|nr:hypothetical protein [Chloroflexota bacterium]
MSNLTSNVLHVGHITSNPRVATLLPSELAHRYLALPVAVDGERVTVAMAHPEDLDARKAVIASLGPATCVIRADAREIERLINELWPQNSLAHMKILSWFPTAKGEEITQNYVQSVAALLSGDLFTCNVPSKAAGEALQQITEAVRLQQPDLLIFRCPDAPLIKQFLLEPAEQPYVQKLPTSLLVTRQPRWPICRILLVLHNPVNDEPALNWCIRLASRAQANVTILPLVASAPAMFAALQARQNLSDILGSDCSLGNQLRQAAQRLADWHIEGRLRLRDEPVDQQVRCEVSEGDYDLIVLGAETHLPVVRWVLGQLVNPLLYWADRPVLIAKPV